MTVEKNGTKIKKLACVEERFEVLLVSLVTVSSRQLWGPGLGGGEKSTINGKPQDNHR